MHLARAATTMTARRQVWMFVPGLDVCTMLEWSTSRHPNIAFFIVCGTDVPVRVSYLYISCEPFVPHRDESNSDRDRSLSLSVDHDNDQLATHLRFSRVLL